MLKENDELRKLLNVDTWHKAGLTGEGVTVALIDSDGIARQIMKDYFLDMLGTQKEIGHATNVGFSAHEFGPGIRVLVFRNNDRSLEWIREHKDEIDLINVSLAGISGMPAPQFLKYEEIGIPLICASGNDNYEDEISYPAAYPFTIAIGATTKTGQDIAGYSNEGPELDAVVPSEIHVQRDDGYIWSVNGTSFASPTACGMLACYIQWRKEHGLSKLKPEEARSFIRENCIDIKDKGFDYDSGYGLFCLPEIPILTTIPVITEPVIPVPAIKEKEIIAMPRIYISPSTQEDNRGVTPFGTEEFEMNKIADALIPLIIKDGRFVIKRNNPSMDVAQIAVDSNNFKADAHVAIHSNAGGGQGTEVYGYAPNTNSDRLAKALYNQIAPLSPGIDRGVKYNPGLMEVGDRVSATAALIELGFHDDLKDATWIAYNPEMISKALYMGICDYFGYDYRALTVAPPVVNPVPIVVDKDIYLSVRCYQSKADQAILDINKLGFAAKRMDLA